MGNAKKIKKIVITDPDEPAITNTAKTRTKAANSVAKVKPRPLMKFEKKKPRLKIDLKTAEIVEKSPTPATASADPAPQKPKIVHQVYLKTRHFAIFVIVVLLGAFFGRVAIWEDQYLSAMEGSQRSQVETTASSTNDEDGVDETEPSDVEIAEYHVAANRPRYLTIRSLGIYNSRVEEAGLNAAGEITVPNNIYNVGWYVNSDLPGVIGGTAVIDGHGGDLGYGIFRNLPRIAIGAEISIEMGDEKTVYTYVVTNVVWTELGDDANNYMETAIARHPGVASLTLITCTGDWWELSKTYSQRLFVHAVLK